MRLAWGLSVLLTIGCAHKPPPPPPPPPPPKGDLLRFKSNPGDELRAKVSLLIDQESAAKQGDKAGNRKMTLSFNFGEEQKVDAVAPDGAASISARLVDASGSAQTGATQQGVDDFALALDELKISFKRTPRGEISAITMSGVRSPLDDKTARIILNAIYAAARGPILPEEQVDVGATWHATTQVPTSFGTSADATYNYKYVNKEGGVAVISCDGALDSKSPEGTAQKRLSGKNDSEYRLDIAGGRLVAFTTDVTTQLEEQVTGQQTLALASKLRVKVDYKPEQK
jgi:hypothetical protein